ncbi:PAS domain-containing protein [Bacillus changyiensis]|uniref:PAS domain-containing protein n=1 Tax=Bacillus changyiensis TaxID=3004103 RepID=UPI0022E4D069|nr:PAS domain-containing protein [Bacillus changyiensis]MDA1475756.1 PAS domain-containing protein [Bacillus changyiensis]
MEQKTKRFEQYKPHVNLQAVLSANGRFIYISANCKEMLGYKQNELIGTYLKDYLHKDDLFLVESYFYNEHHLLPYTFRFVKKDYTLIWIEAAIDFVTTHVGEKEREIVLKMKVFEDRPSTKKKNSHEETGPEKPGTNPVKEEFQAMIEGLPSPLCISVQGKIVYVNDAFVSLLGAEHKQQIIGKYSYDFIEKEYHDIVKNRIMRMQKGLHVGMIEQTWKKLNGQQIHLEVKAAPTVYQNQKAELILLIDISSRKKFQTILQKSRERYQLLIQNSIDTIAVIHKGKWVFMNESGIRLFEAKSYEDLIGKNIEEQLHHCDHEEVKARLKRIVDRKSESEIIKQTWHTFGNRLIYTEMVCIPTTFFGETAVQVILRDISERKQTEELMVRSEKLSIAGQLAAGIAHEIRNPLTAIKGFLQLMKPTMEENEDYFNIIFSELSRIELILSELLMLAKPQQNALQEKLDLIKLIREVTALLETQANLNGIMMNTNLSDEKVCIKGDQNQLKQVFINLIKNAVESMPDGGTVHLSVTETKQAVTVMVQDEGKGIPEHVLKRIGEPFLTTKEKGTGLGLMVTFNIIENHNGTIEIDTQEEKGTTFVISFPK